MAFGRTKAHFSEMERERFQNYPESQNASPYKAMSLTGT
jgi:hypothetical protein